MKLSDKNLFAKPVQRWLASHQNELLIGALTGLAISLALVVLGRNKKRAISRHHIQNTPHLNMERYIFELATDNGIKQAVVESNGECYSVKLDDAFLGTMWQDQHRDMQWHTDDQALQQYLGDIATALDNAFSRKGFSTLLQGAYNEIIRTEWKSSETLEVVISPTTDLEVFSTFLKDELPNLVDFEEHLDLIVKKNGDAYFQIIGVNQN